MDSPPPSSTTPPLPPESPLLLKETSSEEDALHHANDAQATTEEDREEQGSPKNAQPQSVQPPSEDKRSPPSKKLEKRSTLRLLCHALFSYVCFPLFFFFLLAASLNILHLWSQARAAERETVKNAAERREEVHGFLMGLEAAAERESRRALADGDAAGGESPRPVLGERPILGERQRKTSSESVDEMDAILPGSESPPSSDPSQHGSVSTDATESSPVHDSTDATESSPVLHVIRFLYDVYASLCVSPAHHLCCDL